MKKSILNLGKALNKIEQKTINGGRQQGDSGCCVTVTYEDGYRYRSCGLSVSDAQGLYGEHFDNLGGFGGADVTGYCCASC